MAAPHEEPHKRRCMTSYWATTNAKKASSHIGKAGKATVTDYGICGLFTLFTCKIYNLGTVWLQENMQVEFI